MPNSESLPAQPPYPLLVDASTGRAAPPLPLNNLGAVLNDLPGADQRSANSIDLGAGSSVDNPNELSEAGWGILMASDADPAILTQLQPLIDMRRANVQDPALFKMFVGNDGVAPGETADQWARRHGVSLTAPVDPYQGGVPYYLLIVGSPERISFEFQALLKMQWAVGRLYFDDVEDYGRYAQAVLAYEDTSHKPVQRKKAALWVTRNGDDVATAMLCGTISDDFLADSNKLGKNFKFDVKAFTSDDATKNNLVKILRGDIDGGPPAIIFAGSHGCGYNSADPETQRRMQGSLLTQEWQPGAAVGAENLFCADDVPADAQLQGAIGFFFGCYSGGCPAQDSYHFNNDGSPINRAPAPFIARLPQVLLSKGMLAAIAHIDLAFTYAFEDASRTPQPQALRSPLERLMQGRRVGWAADELSIMWSMRAAQLAMVLQAQPAPPPTSAAGAAVATAPVISPRIGYMTIARDDARNYIVLGDPATRLRVQDMN
jgi:hypothetical protein